MVHESLDFDSQLDLFLLQIYIHFFSTFSGISPSAPFLSFPLSFSNCYRQSEAPQKNREIGSPSPPSIDTSPPATLANP
ncbi:hypothetical protein VTP01DRAFT_9719 [Rhizomucor pusillus]|uniref:uncharacterized protein n=1 Tax=Rhizomucor pusillus TaxID=4840 RepID=UPI003742E811